MRKHRCFYLKDKNGKALWCWQEGKEVKRAECTRCLLAYIVSGLFTNPIHRLSANERRSR